MSTPNLQLPEVPQAIARASGTINDGFAMLDVVTQLSVLDKDLSSPPTHAVQGARYIVAAGASGAWAGRARHIAYMSPTGWKFVVPRPNWFAWVDDEQRLYRYNEPTGEWVMWIPPGGGGGGGGDGPITPDTHPDNPSPVDDEFEYGLTIDETGDRHEGATPWTRTTYTGTAPTVLIRQGAGVFQWGTGMTAYRQPVPGGASSFRIRAKVSAPTFTQQYQQHGIHVYHSGTGRWLTNQIIYISSNLRFEAARWVNGSHSASPVNNTLLHTSNLRGWTYLEIECNGTNLFCRFSRTGVDGSFTQYHSEALTTFFGAGNVPDYIGIHGQPDGGPATIGLVDWFRMV